MPLTRIYRGTDEPHDGLDALPAPPPWRTFDGGPALPTPATEEGCTAPSAHRAGTFRPTAETVELVNAALYLRRPLLVTGPPGSGKSSLPYAVARELGLGPVLRWNVTSRSTLRDGLYQYDPLSRLYAASQSVRQSAAGAGLDEHLRLGPLGTALLPYARPRVLLIDEIDKGDLDLPNDLLHVLEDGQYEIDELVRAAPQQPEAQVLTADGRGRAPVRGGRVRCRAFPFTVLTSNAEREFPAAFLRRCVVLELRRPEGAELESIVKAHLPGSDAELVDEILRVFLARREEGELATDQLLNAIYLTSRPELTEATDRATLAAQVMPYLTRGQDDDAF